MTGCLDIFCTYIPLLFFHCCSITRTHVAGIGNIKLSPTLVLLAALHVPELKCNLISVNKLTRDSNCVAKFISSSCQFQDLLSGNTIGSARVHDGLYHFENDQVQSRQKFESSNMYLSMSRNQELLLLHRRLGHPSFSYLKHLFPSLFNNKEFDFFDCEMCQLAKQTRTHFSPKP